MSFLRKAPTPRQKETPRKLPVCKGCGRTGHSKFRCPGQAKATLKTTKPMNKIGRVGKETAKAVAKWKRAQTPNHDLTYNCYMCGNPVDYLMAEHVKSKARNPKLRTDPNNLKPTCGPCNEKKGSKNN